MNLNLKSYVSAAIIAVGIIGLGCSIKAGLSSLTDSTRVVSVKGLCEKEVEANLVTWPVVTKEMGNDLQVMYDNIKRTNATILKFLKSNGISDDEVSVNPPQVEDRQANNYSDDSSIRWRYRVTNVIVVKSSKIKVVNDLMRRQTELMQDGIAIVAGDYQYSTTYEFTELNAIKPEMIATATGNAREAAVKFAEDSGSKLGKIKSATQGQFSIEDRDAYTPYIKNVRVVTSVDYYLDN